MEQHNRIALVAKMHSGKTEIARRLVRDYGFTRFALADGVKDATVDMINAFLKHIGCNPTFTREILDRDKTALRWLLQGVGTELGRTYFGPDSMWIDFFRTKIDAHDGPIVCDDCRFPNEALALRESGFTIVRIERPEALRLQSVREKLRADLIAAGVRDGDEIARAVEDELQRAASHPSETNIALIDSDTTVLNVNLTAPDSIASYLAHLSMRPSTAVTA